MTAHSNREICLYMAAGIEASARDCERIGAPEKAARMFAWAQELRAQAEEPEEIDAPEQVDLFAERVA